MKLIDTILLILCILLSDCLCSMAETLNGIIENINTSERILIHVDQSTSCYKETDLIYDNMYTIADPLNEGTYIAADTIDGVQLFELNKNQEIVFKFTCSNIEHAFGFYDGWLYGTRKGTILREREAEYQVSCLTPINYDWREGRDFKPCISPDGRIAFIKWRNEDVVLCIADPEADGTERGKHPVGMTGGYQEFVLCKEGWVHPSVLWLNDKKVICFRQNNTSDGLKRYEVICVDAEDGTIEPLYLKNGEQFALNDCTLGGLSVLSKDSSDLYVTMCIPSDPLWYMYNEVGVPFDIYKISLETGAKALVLALNCDEYFVEASQIVLSQ